MSCNWLQSTACIQKMFIMAPAGILVDFWSLQKLSCSTEEKQRVAISFIITHFKDRLGAQFIIVSEHCSVRNLKDTWGCFLLLFSLANPQLQQLRSSHNVCLSRAQLSYLLACLKKKTAWSQCYLKEGNNCTQSSSANAQVCVNYSWTLCRMFAVY